MGHIHDFETELRSRIEAIQPAVEPEELIRWLKEQVLQSYRNGVAVQKATGKGERPIRLVRKS